MCPLQINLVLEAKTSSKGIQNFKIRYNLLIYHRIDETFFVSKSFFRRRKHHDNNVVSFLKLHSCFLQSSQSPLFGSTSFGQSEVQVEKNHKNTSTFHTSLSCPRGIELSQSILNRKGTFYYLNSKSKLWLCYGDNGLPTKC